MQQQVSMNVSSTSKALTSVPRLRKNRKIEHRWGLQYQVTAQYAVFGRQCFPYMPTEPPASLSEEIVESEPLHVCKHCKDCFRFQSSFEEHNERRSWIFGLWCQNCFRTVCTHITETGSTCSICIQQDNDKRSYLQKRGLVKSQRLGAIKVFYNQCQLVEHMKMHGLCSIDMTDIMLMPLPSSLSNNDWFPELEIICEALMEYAFISNMHIMDWLRVNKVEHSWWKLINNDDENNDNLISRIVKGYRGRELFKTPNKPADDQFIDSSDTMRDVSKSSLDIEFIDTSFKNKNTNSHSANVISDKIVSENEDNPCMPIDIAFVDCGPTPRCFESESSISCGSKNHMTIVAKSAQDILNWRPTDEVKTHKKKNSTLQSLSTLRTDTIHKSTTIVKVSKKNFSDEFIMKHLSKGSTKQCEILKPLTKKVARNNVNKPIVETDVDKILKNTVKINIPASTSKVKLYKTNSDYVEQDLRPSLVNCGSQILTVQASKNIDIASVISNLPPSLISNKKLVFLGQNSSGLVTLRNKNETIEKKSKKLTADNGDTNTNISQKMHGPIALKKLQERQLANRIVIKNGKKYLIKHPENFTKNLDNSSTLSTSVSKTTHNEFGRLTTEHYTPTSTNTGENISMESTTSLHNDVSILTPSPSPSELSSGSGCESHVKQITKLQKALPQLISLDLAQKKVFESISLIKEESGIVYMNIKLVDHIPKEIFHDMSEMISKCREEMVEEFYQLDASHLKERVDHLQCVSEEMMKTMNFMSEDVLKEKLRSISSLQRILQDCFRKCQNVQNEKDYDDAKLNDWESEFKKLESDQCPRCHKIIKPKSYIAGFSKMPKNENIYCTCYKYVCCECLSYYGTLSRFTAHQNFHKKARPYVCPDCHCKFPSAKLLEIHTWTVCFHILKKRIFACKICEIDGFKDMESITKHFVIMHSVKKFACEECFEVFASYNNYVKHSMEAHQSTLTQNPVRLVVCKLGDEVVRWENYISYLEKYPGIRKLAWFRCPFCSMVTPENKHMTAVLNAHLRDSHMHRLSKIISKAAWNDICRTKFSETGMPSGPVNTFLNTHDALCEDGTVVPKIVNARTITSEVFERGSQDTDDTSPKGSRHALTTNITNMNSRTKKVTNKGGKLNMLKILDVRSMADLNTVESETSMETLTKAKKTCIVKTSESEIIKVEKPKVNKAEEEDSSCKDVKEIKLDDKSDGKKKTRKVEQLDTSNNEWTSSCRPEFQKVPSKRDACAHSTTESDKSISECASKARTENQIKIVDIETICKSKIEPPTTTKLCDTEVKIENTSYVPLTPEQPPPLARIPQHLLTAGSVSKSRNVARSKFLAQKLISKPKRRIAINESREGCIEFLCHLCKEKINTSWSVVRAHFSEKHSREYQLAIITSQLTRLSLDSTEDDYKQIISNKKRKSDVALFASKRKRRWTSRKYTEMKDTSTSDIGLCVEQETAEDGEGNFKCKKCDQRCTDMPSLREHIAANHRLKDRYVICLECGENFVVAPSLQMHLKAFHGIDDTTSYMNQNPSYAPDINRYLETERKTTVANQCYVCMAVFEDKATVDKHLRVHGMAFLNRKRIEARNALKSPEKSTNVMEDKQNLVKESPKEIVRQSKPAETILVKLNAMI